MKLLKVHIKEFQSIRDSNEFDVNDITCLVGKNEAGKTALLQALYRLNPIISNDDEYSVTDDYPRWDVEDYRHSVESGDQPSATVAEATFMLEDDIDEIIKIIGSHAIENEELKICRGYDNETIYKLSIDEQKAIKHLIQRSDISKEQRSLLKDCETVADALEKLNPTEKTESTNVLIELLNKIEQSGGVSEYITHDILKSRIPKFLYFDEYYQMRGCANIESLMVRKENNQLHPHDFPLIGLINLARLDLKEMLNSSRTRELKNSLEGAGNHLTKSVKDYWSQNKHLHLQFDVRPAQPEDPEEMREGTNIWSDVYDTKHMVTTELGTRSRGFVWFFSFLAWYSDIKNQGQNVILLLDEPGLSLHAKAQEDLLRYFEAEVVGNHQLIYTTHSPFMVDPTRFDRARIVQDLSIDTDETLPLKKQGTKVFTDVLEATEDSLFPLQGALGYEIYQTLFVGPNSLIVEGVSDLLFLQSISGFVSSLRKEQLSPKWTITPVGGSDKIPTFVSLLGSQKGLNVATLIDIQKKDTQTIENLYKKKLLKKSNVLTFGDFVDQDEADIEDMFTIDFYLQIVNEEYKDAMDNPIAPSDLKSKNPRIVVKLDEYFIENPLKGKNSYNHYRPARYLSENLSELSKDLPEETIDRFENAFKALNKLIK